MLMVAKQSIKGKSVCYKPNYWWVDSGVDVEWEEFGIYLGEPEYTSSYCNPGLSIPGYAPGNIVDPVIDNILHFGSLSDSFNIRPASARPSQPASMLVDKTCRVSLAPLPDPVTGKMPASVQYPAPLHPTVYIASRPFAGWFISATQPEWPFRPYGTLVGLFWAGFTLFWLWHFFMNYACWLLRCNYQRALFEPVRELLDCWLCMETPGLGTGITVAQKKPCWGECFCFCCYCSDLNGNDKPCCGQSQLCAQFCSEDGQGTPGTFLWDKIGPTSNARQDYGHDYFRNRAADTFTNVPEPRCLGGTAYDFPSANIRAILLVGPQLIGKRTILKFAKARGFETCDLGAEAAPTPEVRWRHALDKFKALREDPARHYGRMAPVIFGAGGTAWEQYAMPEAEVVRLAQVEGVEVVFMLWEADARKTTPGHDWRSETTLTKGERGATALAMSFDGDEPAYLRKNCRAPAALTMRRWVRRVQRKNCSRSDLGAIKERWAEASPRPIATNARDKSFRDANPWNRVFGRRIMVDMDPEEALVRILMPYRWRQTGPSILWGGCTKGAPSLPDEPVDIREFPVAGEDLFEQNTRGTENTRSITLVQAAKHIGFTIRGGSH